jgi:glyoxylase-like metal-dependent hydrolase (beta-lactamase superfamily II)
MEVAPSIHRIEGDLGERYVCQYLLVGEERTLLVDTGLRDMPEQVIAPYLAATAPCAPPLRPHACCAARPTARGSSPTRR